MIATQALWATAVGVSSGRGIIVNFHTLSAVQTLAHITLLARHFEFVSIGDVLGRLRTRQRRPFCAITFDDGKRSNATITAPVLDRLGVPAAFYVCSGFLDQTKRPDRPTTPLWFDRYDALLRVTDPTAFGLAPDAVKKLPAAVRDARLDAACAEHNVDADIDDDDVAPMTWDDARGLHRRGHTIGAHGLWHSILPVEERGLAIDDLRGSIDAVRHEIGECRSFAFPNGNSDEELTRVATDAGADTVVTTEPTWVSGHHEPSHLPRIQLFGEQSADTVRLKLAVARLGRVLPNPDGTGRQYAVPRRLRRSQ